MGRGMVAWLIMPACLGPWWHGGRATMGGGMVAWLVVPAWAQIMAAWAPYHHGRGHGGMADIENGHCSASA